MKNNESNDDNNVKSENNEWKCNEMAAVISVVMK